jgi:hypothetical protein
MLCMFRIGALIIFLKNMTPEEAFTGVHPEVGHFKIFGCHVYIHVPKEKRMKLYP